VMTYNILGNRARADTLVATLRASGADIIAVQELNPAMADAIHTQLASDYPYQSLVSEKGKNDGMGVISRYRLEPINEELPGYWLGAPQVLHVDLDGQIITFVNVHCSSINLSAFAWRQTLEWGTRKREAQAETLAAFAAQRDTPLIIVGDFNTTDQTAAYRVMSSALHDAWRERGFGFGHTFPGPYTPYGNKASLVGWSRTLWLARIDYIYHSDEWSTLEIHTGPEIGKSDHRPVVASLSLIDAPQAGMK
ncbi:MAG: hypothetical protein HGA19_20395, partial [Oscillochloris sp.]|nr:hypothetical protein [Oscillochloris sp.]